jgi:hypothetical protein
MTLDITRIASQVGDMIGKITSGRRERQEHLKCAADRLGDKTINLESLKRKIALARTPNWSPAGLVDGLSLHLSPPAAPQEYTVVAADGSHIDVDRHRAANCYLINTSLVTLHYGQNPLASLESWPRLYSEDSDLVIANENNVHQQHQIRGPLLDAKRSVEEIHKLVEGVSSLSQTGPVLALMDGSLVMYGMQNYPDFVIETLIDKGLLRGLDELKKIGESHPVAVASYISLPQSDDVVNALRIAMCPQDTVDCDRYCLAGEAPCDAVSGVSDRVLFETFLGTGERSAVFINPSLIVEKRYGRHQVYFFYLRVEDEIARVEMPEWVAMDKNLIGLTHAMVLDQCLKGQGYPVALSEAHEQAVVTGADREEFWRLVEDSLEEQKIPAFTSTKSRSKRTRWI